MFTVEAGEMRSARLSYVTAAVRSLTQASCRPATSQFLKPCVRLACDSLVFGSLCAAVDWFTMPTTVLESNNVNLSESEAPTGMNTLLRTALIPCSR